MNRNYYIVSFLLLIYFVISLLTNILGPLIPDIISGFGLSLTMAAFLPFSFFIAYGVMSIPSGWMVEKQGEKTVIIAAFAMAFIGAILFAVFPFYPVALSSLFIIGLGMAMLQVAINPLLRVTGGEEHFAFNAVLAQLVFGLASYASPQVYSYLVMNLKNSSGATNLVINTLGKVVPAQLPWISLYWVFAVVTIGMVLLTTFVRFPKIERKADEKAGAWLTYKSLFRNKTVVLYFLAIFAYVGTEQGIANWISKFLSDYHGLNPQSAGADVVSWFWGLLTAGCLLGLLLLKILDSRKLLIWFSIGAIVSLTVALFGSVDVAIICFPLTGFFASVMWSIIFSLALNSLEKHHGSFSGLLCTGIIGGAIVPLVIGWLGDLLGLRFGMLFLYLMLGYILSIGFWARPLIANATIANKNIIKND